MKIKLKIKINTILTKELFKTQHKLKNKIIRLIEIQMKFYLLNNRKNLFKAKHNLILAYKIFPLSQIKIKLKNLFRTINYLYNKFTKK